MGKLAGYLADIERMATPAVDTGPSDQETRTRELREALGVVVGLVEQLCNSMPATADMKGVESALKGLSKAFKIDIPAPTVNVEAPSVTVEAPSVSVEPAVVNVAAPEVKVEVENERGMVRFDIYRDDKGLLKSVVATPIEEYEDDSGLEIE